MLRTVGDQIRGFSNEVITIGTDIPPLRVSTVEVRYYSDDQAIHDATYRPVIDQMTYPAEDKAGSSGDKQGRQDMAIFRGLCFAAFSPLILDLLAVVGAPGTYSDQIAEYLSAPDHGFTAFWTATCRVRSQCRPADAVTQVYYLIAQCPRLRELLRILHKEGAFSVSAKAKDRPRFLIITNWPLTCWLVDMVLRRIGLVSESITAAYSAEERAASVAEFNDPNSECQALVTTYLCGGTGLNLHDCCHIVILMEPATNFNMETQAIGRVHRIGQQHPQRAYRIFQDHTVNRYIIGRNIRKMLPQLATQYPDVFAQELRRRQGSQTWDDKQRGRAIEEVAEDFLRLSMGVAPDFPYYGELLDKEALGIERSDADDGAPTSNRRGFTSRGQDFPPVPVPPRLDPPVIKRTPSGKKRKQSSGATEDSEEDGSASKRQRRDDEEEDE